jgi:hypothetical protein
MNKDLCIFNWVTQGNIDCNQVSELAVFHREKPPLSLDESEDYRVDIIPDNIETKIVANQPIIDNLIIVNRITLSEVTEKAARQLMVRCFCIVKGMMPIVMQNKGCRIWLVHCRDSGKAKIGYGALLQSCLKEGFLSLTRVFAMEMAKRRININFVGIQRKESWPKFVRHVEYLRSCNPLNLTAQGIEIEQ